MGPVVPRFLRLTTGAIRNERTDTMDTYLPGNPNKVQPRAADRLSAAGMSILISGIGIAGPTLAYWLAARGMKPTLIERAPDRLQFLSFPKSSWAQVYSIIDLPDYTDIASKTVKY